jgi:hypothetical protein
MPSGCYTINLNLKNIYLIDTPIFNLKKKECIKYFSCIR